MTISSGDLTPAHQQGKLPLGAYLDLSGLVDSFPVTVLCLDLKT